MGGGDEDHANWLGTLTADQIPSDKKWFLKRGYELASKNDPDASADYNLGFAIHVLTCAVGSLLVSQGWTIETAPGKPIVLVKGLGRFNPRESISKLADGSLSAEDWKVICQSFGMAGSPLATGTS